MKEKWNAWDVPFFVTPGSAPLRPVASATAAATEPEHPPPQTATAPTPLDQWAPSAFQRLPLAGEGSLATERTMSILLAFGSVLGGLVVFGALMLFSFVASFGSTPSPVVPAIIGVLVAAGGITLSVLGYRAAARPAEVVVGADRLEIRFPTFRDPLVVSRAMVRAVAIDDKPVQLFQNNKRFEIAGTLPGHVFADQLDNRGRAPWEDFDPEHHKPQRTTPSVWGALGGSPASIGDLLPTTTPATNGAASSGPRPADYRHDDPEQDGWASGGTATFPEVHKEPGYLWSAHGSSLPFAGLAPGDAPNIAILFHEPHKTSKPPWWYDLSPVTLKCGFRLRGGRPMRGVLLKVRNTVAAEAAFGSWGVVRQITATDVLEEGLIVAKPLKGIRALVYAGLFILSIVVELVIRLMK